MSESSILFWARAVERLMIVAFGGLSMVLGWNLFRLKIQKDQTAELRVKDWTIRLARVGPGVFFALFGAVVLGVALDRPISTKSNPQAPNAAPSGESSARAMPAGQSLETSYVLGTSERGPQREIKAINTIEQFVLPKTCAGLSPVELEAVAKAREVLSLRRDELLRQMFGKDVDRFANLRAAGRRNPSVFDGLLGQDRERYYRYDGLLASSFVGEGR